jgi:hypothetical protein
MSTTYLVYTEVKIENKWVCASPYIRNEKGKEVLVTTYESGSRSYFGNTFDKFRELNVGIDYPDGLSAELKKRFYDDILERYKRTENNHDFYNDPQKIIDYYRRSMVAIPLQMMQDALPLKSELKYQYHGLFHKDDIYRYESGESEYLEPVDAKRYGRLTEEERKAYMYYEYDDTMDWPYYFKKIIEYANFTATGYLNAISKYWEENPEIRIIAFEL